jgi:hypothetical protein
MSEELGVSRSAHLHTALWVATTRRKQVESDTHLSSVQQIRDQLTKDYLCLVPSTEDLASAGDASAVGPYFSLIKEWIASTTGRVELGDLVIPVTTGPVRTDYVHRCLDSRPIVLVSPVWLYVVSQHHGVRAIPFLLRIRQLLAEHSASLLFFPADPASANLQMIMKALTSGHSLQISQSNTSLELARLGVPEGCGPLLFLWPPSAQEEWWFAGSQSEKNAELLYPRQGSSDSRRPSLMAGLADLASSLGISAVESPGNLPWDDYVALVKRARIVATTNHLAERYRGQLMRYRAPSTATTSRCWQAFATRALLIAQESSALHALGFRPSIHYVSLPDSPSEIPRMVGPFLADRERQVEIAIAGQSHFRALLDEERIT